jgi:excisionase family DNA binding protein
MPVAKPKSNTRTSPTRRPEPICLYSVKEVAEQCGLSEKTIRRMIDARKLRAQRAGRSIRITHAELLAFLGLAPNAAR